MTTDRQKTQQPYKPGHVKTTQRIVEREDWDNGDSDVYFNLFAKEVVPQYENKVKNPPRGVEEDEGY